MEEPIKWYMFFVFMGIVIALIGFGMAVFSLLSLFSLIPLTASLSLGTLGLILCNLGMISKQLFHQR